MIQRRNLPCKTNQFNYCFRFLRQTLFFTDEVASSRKNNHEGMALIGFYYLFLLFFIMISLIIPHICSHKKHVRFPLQMFFSICCEMLRKCWRNLLCCRISSFLLFQLVLQKRDAFTPTRLRRERERPLA